MRMVSGGDPGVVPRILRVFTKSDETNAITVSAEVALNHHGRSVGQEQDEQGFAIRL